MRCSTSATGASTVFGQREAIDVGETQRLAPLRAAFPHTLPVMPVFILLAVTYGVLMQTKGYGPLWSTLMSAVAYGGSMQFAAIALLTAAFDPMQAFFLSCMVNARHLFYGLSMLEKYRGLGKARIPLIYTLCDETFALVYATEPPAGVEPKRFYLSISLLNYTYWVAGTALGGFLGDFIPFNTTGLDFALPALFVVLFLEQCKKKENRPAGVIGVGASVLCLVLFGPDRLVLCAMLVIVAVLLGGRKKLCT